MSVRRELLGSVELIDCRFRRMGMLEGVVRIYTILE